MLSIILVSDCIAQSVDQGQRLLEERRAEQLQKRAKRQKGGLQITVGAIAKPGQEKPCFPIRSVDVTGATKIAESEISKVVKEQISDCMGPKGIGALLQAISKLYIEAGYITSRALLPEQDLSTGFLQITIVEGRIGDFAMTIVRDEKKEEAAKSKVETAFPGLKGKILYLRDVEQGLDQINRLKSNTATLDIKPGEKPGESILAITNKVEDRFRGFVETYVTHDGDTHTSQANLSFEADDLLNINDTWYIAYSGGSSSNSMSFSASAPYGFWLYSMSGSYSEELSQLTSSSDLFQQSTTATAQVERLMFRDAKSKLKVSGSFTYKWSKRWINASDLTPQKLAISGTTVSYEHYLPGAFISVYGGLQVGLPVLGVPQDAPADTGAPQARFGKLNVGGAYYKAFETGMTLYSSAATIFSSDPLYSTEQLTIGGSSTVRGFESGQQAGEQGIYIQNTLTFPMHTFWGGADAFQKSVGTNADWLNKISSYAFLDLGAVRNVANDKTYHMSGIGAGFKISTDVVSTDLYFAWPVKGLSNVETSKLEARLRVTVKTF